MSAVDNAAIVADAAAIIAGTLGQFANPLTLSGLSVGRTPVKFELSQVCNALWLPRYIALGGTLVTQDNAAVLGIQINRLDAPMIPWGLRGDLQVTFTGPVQRIYVTKLSDGNGSDLTLFGAVGVAIGYSSSSTIEGDNPSIPSVDGYRIGSGVRSGTHGVSTHHSL